MGQPLHEFTSHISGKNARVSVFPDHIEWERQGRVTASRALGGALLTGSLRKGGETEVMPIRAVTSVTTKKGLRNTRLVIIASGNTIEANVGHAEAAQIKATLLRLMAG